MRRSAGNARVLVYSHDSFGLGHLRRCRTIAHTLVAERKGVSVLILSGSPIIGSFDFRTRVDFVRVPGVIKLRSGEYCSLNLHMDVSEILDMRAAIIRHTAEEFEPDLLIVDHAPLGLRGEMSETLRVLESMGTRLVLGVRDVLDHPDSIAEKWEQERPLRALSELYDDILVYGSPMLCNPFHGLLLPPQVRRKVRYTGYLRTHLSEASSGPILPAELTRPFVLVTAGGGRDGEPLVDWVLRAYEADPDLPNDALIALGPFMRPKRRAAFLKRVSRLPGVHAVTFHPHLERVMARAAGVVAMGGYNTFCEILSFDKPAVLVPRRAPRLEQYLRAMRAREMGLVRMLDDRRISDTQTMVQALRAITHQPRPSEAMVTSLLDGLETVNSLANDWLSDDLELPIAAVGA